MKNIDLSKYSKEEIKEIEQLINDIKNIKNNTSNEEDDVEKNRKSKIDSMLTLFDDAKVFHDDEETKKILDNKYIQLLKDKESVRDGGKLYKKIFELLTNNNLVNVYANNMNDKKLLEFITKYIYAPLTPNITQEEFNELVNAGIKDDEREALWRLAVNYNQKNMNFSLIEDYFIKVRDDYYLIELISTVKEDLELNKLTEKIKNTKDEIFINNCINRAKTIELITEEDIKKINS